MIPRPKNPIRPGNSFAGDEEAELEARAGEDRALAESRNGDDGGIEWRAGVAPRKERRGTRGQKAEHIAMAMAAEDKPRPLLCTHAFMHRAASGALC